MTEFVITEPSLARVCVPFVAAKSMAKAERDDALNALVCNFPLLCVREREYQREQASRLFAAMLDDIMVDVALQSHQEVARSRRKCDVCYTQCVFLDVCFYSSLVADIHR